MRWPDDVDPADLRQPDARSCGATVVVAARMLVETGHRPESRAAVAAEILSVHRRLTSARGLTGRLQPPWPRALGTPPWAVAAALRGLTGHDVRTRPCRWRVAEGWAALTARAAGAASDRRPVAVYIGSTWLPRHVVLIVSVDDDVATAFDPARGRLVRVPRARWVERRLDVAGWSTPWAVV